MDADEVGLEVFKHHPVSSTCVRAIGIGLFNQSHVVLVAYQTVVVHYKSLHVLDVEEREDTMNNWGLLIASQTIFAIRLISSNLTVTVSYVNVWTWVLVIYFTRVSLLNEAWRFWVGTFLLLSSREREY